MSGYECAVDRRPHRPDALFFHGDIGTPEGAAQVQSEISSRVSGLDAVVASLGWWQPGYVIQMDPATWHDVLDQNLTVHWLAARTFLPMISPGGSYTLINGTSSQAAYPGGGAMSIAAAAEHMLKEALHVELEATGAQVRVNDLVLGVVSTRNRLEHRPEWVTADDVGTVAVQVADSHVRGETLRLPDKAAITSVLERLHAVTA